MFKKSSALSIIVLTLFAILLVGCNGASSNDSVEKNPNVDAPSSNNNSVMYTINFDTNGGFSVSSITQLSGSTLTLPNPSRDGFIFDGWYIDSTLNQPFDLSKMPNSDITLYAKWIQLSITISFNSNGGFSVSSITQLSGSTLTLPNPIRDGFIFDGWYIDSTLNQPFDLSKMPNSDITLYAKWIEILPNSLYLNYSSLTLEAGENFTLIATVLPINANNTNVTWQSTNPFVATVVEGVIVAHNSGHTTIVASTLNGITVYVNLTVNNPKVNLTTDNVSQYFDITVTPISNTNLVYNFRVDIKKKAHTHIALEDSVFIEVRVGVIITAYFPGGYNGIGNNSTVSFTFTGFMTSSDSQTRTLTVSFDAIPSGSLVVEYQVRVMQATGKVSRR